MERKHICEKSVANQCTHAYEMFEKQKVKENNEMCKTGLASVMCLIVCMCSTVNVLHVD